MLSSRPQLQIRPTFLYGGWEFGVGEENVSVEKDLIEVTLAVSLLLLFI